MKEERREGCVCFFGSDTYYFAVSCDTDWWLDLFRVWSVGSAFGRMFKYARFPQQDPDSQGPSSRGHFTKSGVNSNPVREKRERSTQETYF